MKQGCFTLEVVNADTKNAFQEHSKEGGKVYAEVEPEIEYFIQLSSDAWEPVYVDLKVDGTYIEKGRRLDPGSSRRMGIWKKEDDEFVELALMFDVAPIHERGSRTTAPEFWTGVIEARFFGDPKFKMSEPKQPAALVVSPDSSKTSVSSGRSSATTDSSRNNKRNLRSAFENAADTSFDAPIYQPRKNSVFTEAACGDLGDVGYCKGLGDDKHRKGVKTVRGEKTLSTFKITKPKSRPTKRAGAPKPSGEPALPRKSRSMVTEPPQEEEYPLLGTLTIHYCSTVGLIRACLLPEPPGWDDPKPWKENPKNCEIMKELRKMKFEKVRVDRVVGGVIQESKEVDMFDLSDC
jgi:hypothetical protein